MLGFDMDERQCLLVIFGASGDLTRRKLIPGLFELHIAGLLSSHVGVLGITIIDVGSAAELTQLVTLSSAGRGSRPSA